MSSNNIMSSNKINDIYYIYITPTIPIYSYYIYIYITANIPINPYYITPNIPYDRHYINNWLNNCRNVRSIQASS